MTDQSSRVSIIRARRSRRTVGVLLVAAGVAAGVTSAPKVAQAAPPIAAAWTSAKTIPKALTTTGPALAVFDGLLYAAWTAKTTPYHLWYATYNGTTWAKPTEVPSALTGEIDGPALGVYNGKLYLAWLGQTSSPSLWYSAFNGTSWTGQAKVPTGLAHPYTSPALAAYNGDLYLSWIGSSSAQKVWYSDFNGTTWSAQATIPGAASSLFDSGNNGGPALAVYQSKLFASWNAPYSCTSEMTYCIAAASFNGSSWTAPTYVLGENPAYNGASGPALAVDGSTLYDAWYDGYVESLMYTSFNGTSWTTYKTIPSTDSGTCDAPGLATYNGSLFIAWQRGGNQQCLFSAGVSYISGP